MYHHRAGKLSQQNKSHKVGGHSTKRSIDKALHGRIETKQESRGGVGSVTGTSVKSLSSITAAGKADRINHVQQLKEQRKAELLVAKRLSGGYGPPKVICSVGLSSSVSLSSVAASLLLLSDDSYSVSPSESLSSPLTLSYNTFRQRITLLQPPRGGQRCTSASSNETFHYDVTHTISVAQMADVVLVTVDMSSHIPGPNNAPPPEPVDEEGDLFLSCLKSVGMPTVVGVILGLEKLPPQRVSEARRYANRLFTTEFGSEIKVVEVECPFSSKNSANVKSSSLHLVRAVTSILPKQVTWRSNRSFILADSMSFQSQDNGVNDSGTLTLRGYVRGRPFNVHQLLCLPGSGVYSIESVEFSADAGKASSGTRNNMDISQPQTDSVHEFTLDGEYVPLLNQLGHFASKVRIISQASAANAPIGSPIVPQERFREPLETVVDLDVNAGEQALPVADDEAIEEKTASSKTHRPKGMSAAQAAWLDSEDEANASDYETVSESEEDGVWDRNDPEYLAKKAEKKQATLTAMKDDRERLIDRHRKKKLEPSVEENPSRAENRDDDDDDVSMEDDEGGYSANQIMNARAAVSTDATGANLTPEEMDAKFPDEVDTPVDVPARVRFARYRGLKSFRTSPWDPKESLPPSYARLFQFSHFPRTQRNILKESELAEKTLIALETQKIRSETTEKKQKRKHAQHRAAMARNAASSKSASIDEDVEMDESEDAENGDVTDISAVIGEGWIASGKYVTVKLRNVSKSLLENSCVNVPGVPVFAFPLLRHENRTSVVHFSVSPYAGLQSPIKSKDSLEFRVGFRLFDAKPLFSSPAPGTDRNKFERYFRPTSGITTVSVFAPVCYSPLPVLIFKRTLVQPQAQAIESLYPATDVLLAKAACVSTKLELVATGTVSTIDPDRIILKRTVLSGFPLKVKRRSAVVRYMFFNPQDVDWFLPIEVFTKHGSVGHIKESVGTHGAMKVTFDRPIKQHDTICLSLYKRVYPRWGACYVNQAGLSISNDDDMKFTFTRENLLEDDDEL
jgi:pre-rRNA-processing protein TSR1